MLYEVQTIKELVFMSKVGKYDKLFKYISKKISYAKQNSVENLQKQLETLEREEKHRSYCIASSPSDIDAAKIKLSNKILQKMEAALDKEISSEKNS